MVRRTIQAYFCLAVVKSLGVKFPRRADIKVRWMDEASLKSSLGSSWESAPVNTVVEGSRQWTTTEGERPKG